MTDFMHYAFIDESGTVGVPGGTHFLVVALVNAEHPREIEMPVRRVYKKYGRSLKHGEIKASEFEEKAIYRLLEEISKQNISIFSTIVDQSIIRIPPKEMEDIYRKAVAKTIYHLVEQYPRVNICLDRRYTNKNHRFKLEIEIRRTIQDLPQKIVLIQQEDSVKRKELQAADAVAWAFFQKYENKITDFYDLISSKIEKEEVFEPKNWKKLT